MAGVISLFGGPTGAPEVHPVVVEELERLLEMARSGELIGFTASMLIRDGSASYTIAGKIGGYSMIGGLEVAKSLLIEAARDDQ